MRKKKPTFEWSVVEDDLEWQAIQAATTEPMPRMSGHGELRLSLLVILLFLLLAGGWVWYTQAKHEAIVRELQDMISQDATAEIQSTSSGGATVAPPRSDYSTAAHAQDAPSGHPADAIDPAHLGIYGVVKGIDEYHVQGDRTFARMTVSYPAAEGGWLTYRETRFYSETTEGWRRIDPDPALMGPLQTLETEHFTIHYYALDAAAVAETAPRLERLYEQIRRDFGLPANVSLPAIMVEVATSVVEGNYRVRDEKRTLTVRSPTLLSVPVEITAATVFYDSLVFPLAKLVMMDRVNQYPDRENSGAQQWGRITDALLLWEFWEDAGPLAAPHEDVLRWLSQNTQAGVDETDNAQPEAYDHICRTYRVWELSPWDTFIPLSCTKADESRWRQWPYPSLLLRLDNLLHIGQSEEDWLPSPRPIVQILTAETVVEYIVATYGRNRLPLLMDALDKHSNWHTLIPTLFGVSASDFEAGWHSYLAQQYNVSLGN